MMQNDSAWKLFTATGKVEDYLKYRHKEDARTDITKEKERDGRDMYGDGNGIVSHAHWGI